MIRRKSTLDTAERIRRTKQVEIFSVLDLCLQLPSDDRLILRNQIKEGDQQLSMRILQCKKDKNYHSLQIYLRKYIQKYKEDHKFGINVTRHSNRGKTPITLKSTKNVTESSFHNSLRNSLQSSPSAKKQSVAINKLDIEKHIENQINKQIKEGINRQQCQVQCKDITPRQFQPSSNQIQIMRTESITLKHQRNRANINTHGIEQLNIKNIIKSKMSEINNQKKLRISPEKYKERIQNQYKQNISNYKDTNMYKFEPSKTEQVLKQKQPVNIKYGQFYKRIKRVIEEVS